MTASAEGSHDSQQPAPGPVGEAPYYVPTARERELFRAAFERRLPVMLKGPTGCG